MSTPMFAMLSIDTWQKADRKVASTIAAGTRHAERPLLRGKFLSALLFLPVRGVSIESVDRNSAPRNASLVASSLARRFNSTVCTYVAYHSGGRIDV